MSPPELPETFQRWFDIVRVVVLFFVGVGLIIYAVTTTGHDIPFIVAGLVLCGLVPADLWLTDLRDRRRRDEPPQTPRTPDP